MSHCKPDCPCWFSMLNSEILLHDIKTVINVSNFIGWLHELSPSSLLILTLQPSHSINPPPPLGCSSLPVWAVFVSQLLRKPLSPRCLWYVLKNSRDSLVHYRQNTSCGSGQRSHFLCKSLVSARSQWFHIDAGSASDLFSSQDVKHLSIWPDDGAKWKFSG